MKKLLNKKGFTLMEMLIVVAIIVILAAISIPAFSGSLDKANEASDAANLKAAKASFVTQSMLAEGEEGYLILDGSKSYYYDFEKGAFVEGDGDDAKAANSLGSCKYHKAAYIEIVDTLVAGEEGEEAAGDGILDKVQWNNGTVNCEKPEEE